MSLGLGVSVAGNTGLLQAEHSFHQTFAVELSQRDMKTGQRTAGFQLLCVCVALGVETTA